MSVDSLGQQTNHPQPPYFGQSCGISETGRYVAFASPATDLVPGDTNGAADVFVHDRLTGSTRRVDVTPSGDQGNAGAWFEVGSVVSADGRFVCFTSGASNLVPGDGNGSDDVFRHDLLTGVTTCVSVDGAGVPQGGCCAVISADGRFVAYSAFSAPSWQNGAIVRDCLTGVSVDANVDSLGNPGNNGAWIVAMSGDGRLVAFNSDATNLVAGDTNLAMDVFVHDLQSGSTTRVSVDSNGVQGNLPSDQLVALSANGRYVAFESRATNLVAGDTNGASDVFVHDRQTGQTTRASVGPAGQEGFGFSYWPSISADGRYVSFASSSSNLVPADTNGTFDVFIHDMQTGDTLRVSSSSTGAQSNSFSDLPWISADGRSVVFASNASNLVPRDTNGVGDVFVHDRIGCSPTIASYCDAGQTSHGCAPILKASGAPSASAGSGFVISASSIEGQSFGLVFYGVSGPATAPFGGGGSTLCVNSPLQRTRMRSTGGTAGACDGQFSIDWNTFVAGNTHLVGAPFTGGETVWAQAWLRDPGAPGGGTLSNALWFSVCP